MTAAKSESTNTIIVVGTGNAENYYIDDAFKTAADVDKAIAEYDAAVAAAVAEANKATDPVEASTPAFKPSVVLPEYALP